MKGLKYFSVLILLSVFTLTGCAVMTYSVRKDRVDQEVSGNKGYLKGTAPADSETAVKKSDRATYVTEIEVRNPFNFKKKAKKVESEEEGNKGYVSSSVEIDEEAVQESFEKYTVQKNDTLQKISQKFFGTTKKWTRIFDANKDVLKGPNSIYPGQVINIPVEIKETSTIEVETKENLK